MVLPGRSYSSGTQYRYGFNGKENDKDISEGGQDYGMRIYDSRLGRFLSVDPLTKEYPWNSTYAFAENDVLRSIDLDGLERLIIHENRDKYGRVTSLVLSGIRSKDSKLAVEMNMKSALGVKLSTQDVYIIRHRNNRGGQIFFEGIGGGITRAQENLIKNSPSGGGEESDDIPEGTMQRSESTGRGNFYHSATVDLSKNEFFDTPPLNGRPRSPIVFDGSSIKNADWVGGTILSGDGAGTSRGVAPSTANNIASNIDGFISTFKKTNNINVAFVEQIVITLNNNDNRNQWNAIQANLTATYATQVRIVIDPNIQARESGAAILPGTRVSGTYGSISYRVSGVSDGDKNNADMGNR